jgi:YD repeat-containing protein
MRRVVEGSILVLTGLSAVAFSACAQEGTKGEIDKILDENGISVSVANPEPSITEAGVSIGDPKLGGLAFERTIQNFGSFYDWGHNYNFQQSFSSIIDISEPTFYDTYASITAGQWRDDFDWIDGTPTGQPGDPRLGSGAKLTSTPSSFMYTAKDGSVAYFPISSTTSLPSDDYDYGYPVPFSIGTLMTKPNGEKLYLTYYEAGSGGNVYRRRLMSVQNSYGYHLKFEYATDVRTSSNIQEWHRLIKVTAINGSVDYCSPTALHCTGLSQTWPQATYSMSAVANTGSDSGSYPRIITDISTDAAGAVRVYAFKGALYRGELRLLLSSYARGNPSVTVANFGGGGFVSLPVVTEDGTTQYYCLDTWPDEPLSDTTNEDREHASCRIDPLGGQRSFIYGAYDGKARKIRDETGRVWRFQYDSEHRLLHTIPPEGTVSGTNPPTAGYTKNIYDLRGNIKQTITVPKLGSGLPNIETLADYPEPTVALVTDCAQPKTCNKPNWIQDANGNRTHFTYDSNHGGVLSELKPAVTIGAPGSTVSARPLTLATWAQRYAWIKNASGTLVQSSDPIWMIATKIECQASPGSNSPVCDATKPQTITSYQYGSTGTRESLLVKGVAITSSGTTLRICYGYDVFDRRISETKSNANLSACP